MSEMWNSVAPGWEANAQFVDEHLALATETLLDAAGIGEGNAVLDLAAGPGGAGLAAAERVGPSGTVVLSDVAAEMVAVAARRASAHPQVSTAVFDQTEIAAQRALSTGANASRREGDQIVFAGSVLIGSGYTPTH